MIGATAFLLDTDTGKEYSYTLVSELEADFAQGKISINSPLGQGLLGHKEGEDIEITVPQAHATIRCLRSAVPNVCAT